MEKGTEEQYRKDHYTVAVYEALVKELQNEIMNLETDLASKKAVIAEQSGVRKKTALEAIAIVQEWRNSSKMLDKLVHTFGVYDDIYSKKQRGKRTLMFEDTYCECGQYLTTYLMTLGKVIERDSIRISGIPCPAKECNKSYTLKKTPTDCDTCL